MTNISQPHEFLEVWFSNWTCSSYPARVNAWAKIRETGQLQGSSNLYSGWTASPMEQKPEGSKALACSLQQRSNFQVWNIIWVLKLLGEAQLYDALNWRWLEQDRDPSEWCCNHALHDLVCCQCLQYSDLILVTLWNVVCCA